SAFCPPKVSCRTLRRCFSSPGYSKDGGAEFVCDGACAISGSQALITSTLDSSDLTKTVRGISRMYNNSVPQSRDVDLPLQGSDRATVPAGNQQPARALRSSDQYAGRKYQRPAERHLHRRRQWRCVHIAMAYPGDGRQFNQHHGNGDRQGEIEAVDQEG